MKCNFKDGEFVENRRTGEQLLIMDVTATKYLLSNGKEYTHGSMIKMFKRIKLVESITILN